MSLLIAAALALAACATAAASKGDSRLAGHLPGKRDTGRTVVLEADVACSPARSFAMWSTTEGAESFYATRAQIGAVGGPYTVVFYPDEDPQGLVHGTAGAHVLAAEPNSFYAFEWVVFAGDDTKGDNAPPYTPDDSLRLPATLPTWVELTFTPNANGTHVAFRHYGFGEGDLYARSRDWFQRAWGGVLQSMTQVCARG